MNEPADDFHFERRLPLRDGRMATIRLARADDKPRLREAFAKLDRQSIYTRFFSYRKDVPQESLDRIDHIDLEHLAALVVTLGSGGGEIVIAGASYVADTAADGTREAEVAFTVEEDFQGQGLAGRLLDALVEIARHHGIARFRAEVLAVNAPMLAVFRRCRLPMHQRRIDEIVELTMDLGESG